MPKTCLLDGDQLMYSVGFAAQNEPLNYALNTVKRSLDKIQKHSGCDEREIWIRGRGNFRDAVAVSAGYKATRKTLKPKWFKEIHEYLIQHQGAMEAHGMEADDMLSVRLFADYAQGTNECVLASQDKDLLNTPGLHFNPRSPQAGVFEVTPEEAFEHFWYQMLSGDRVDNIPGLPGLTPEAMDEYSLVGTGSPGCGEKRGWEIVMRTDPALLPRTVFKLYSDWFHARTSPAVPESLISDQVREYFTEQGRLLWMTRELNADGTPVLWDPDWYPCW